MYQFVMGIQMNITYYILMNNILYVYNIVISNYFKIIYVKILNCKYKKICQ